MTSGTTRRGRANRTSRESRRVAAAVALVLAVAGLVAGLWRPTAGLQAATTALADFLPEVLAAAEAYRGPVRAAEFLRLAVGVLVPVLFVVSRPGRAAVRGLAGDGGGAWRGGLVALGMAVTVSLAQLPLSVWIGWFHDGSWGFRTADLGTWTRDWLLGNGIGWGLGATTGLVLVVAVRRWPASWHWRLVPVGTLLGAVLVLGWPVVVEPLFYDTTPLPDGPARTEIESVLDAAGSPDVPIVVGDASRRTTRVNAFVTGLGPTRRVVVFDNLLELPPDRVGLVVAHELAHREHRDLLRGVLLSASGLLAGLVLLRLAWRSETGRRLVSARSDGDPRLVAVALAVAAVAQLGALPVTNWVSRRAEAAADARAIELTGAPGTFAVVARAFTVRDLAEPDRPATATHLWGTHPTVHDRIRAAAGFAGERGLPLPSIEEVRAAEDAYRHPAIDLAERTGS